MSRPSAGWYPDPQGGSSQRWWDGQAWTGQARPAPPAVPPPAPSPEPDSVPAAEVGQPSSGHGRTGASRRWLLVAGMFAVVVVAAAGGWWAAGGGGPSEPDVSVASDEAGQDPGDAGPGTDLEADGGDGAAARSELPPPTDAQQWTRVAHDERVFGGEDEQWMLSVAAGGPGLVAVGFDRGRGAAAVWTSTNGTAWQRVPQGNVRRRRRPGDGVGEGRWPRTGRRRY